MCLLNEFWSICLRFHQRIQKNATSEGRVCPAICITLQAGDQASFLWNVWWSNSSSIPSNVWICEACAAIYFIILILIITHCFFPLPHTARCLLSASQLYSHLQRVPKTGVADQLSGPETEHSRSTFSVMKRIRQHFRGSVCSLVDCLKLQIWNARFLQRINSSFDPMSKLTNASFPITFKHMVPF